MQYDASLVASTAILPLSVLCVIHYNKDLYLRIGNVENDAIKINLTKH